MIITSTNDFGECIKKSRKKFKLTQAQLAAVSNVGVRFIRELEKGKSTCQIEKSFYVARCLGLRLHLEREKHEN